MKCIIFSRRKAQRGRNLATAYHQLIFDSALHSQGHHTVRQRNLPVTARFYNKVSPKMTC